MTADTAATAALGPEPIPGSGPGATADDTPVCPRPLPRLGTPARRRDTCSHPIQLRSRTDMIDLATGELAPSTARPQGVLSRCGNRREAVCPACSATYKRDARQLVRAGLAGGKGIPETITGHPCVFATLTAPSFGPVHSRRMRGKTVLPCRPRRDAKARRCPHGRDISCPTRHARGRPPARPAHVRATATTTKPRCCSTPTRPTCGAGSPPTCPATWPASPGHHPEDPARPGSASGSSRSPSTRHAASSTSTPSSAWTPPARTTSPRPPAITADLLCDAIGLAAAAAAARHRARGPGRQARLRRADRHPDHPPRRRTARHRPGR